ncbi:MAG: HlyD family secretion protein, partial [Streptosporangiaceae bacterium]|nr:HlyD family secretion protein [Streptosporangiaceae bacterium]
MRPLVTALARHKLRATGIVVLVAVAGGGYMYVHAASPTTQYRTAAATLGTIEQTLALTGNLSPVSQSNVNFQVSGTVTAVDVSAGQTVTAGQVLATVDSTALQASLVQAQDTLAAAQAKMAADQASTAAATAAQQISAAQTNLANDEVADTDTVAVNAQTLTADQRTISSDQATVASDGQAVAAAQQRYNADGCTSSSTGTTCATDAQNLSNAQQQLTKDTQAFSAAESTLQMDIVRTKQSNDQAAAKVSSDRTALSNAELSGNSSNSAAAQQAAIAQDTASVSQAQQAVTTDTTAVNEATLVAPSAGTVAAVNTSVGSTVAGSSSAAAAASSAASSSSSTPANFIILAPGSFQVTGTISDSQVNEVAVGQHAVVTPAGSTSGLSGSVTSVGEIATVSSGVATFPVTVQVTGVHPSLRDGMSATISVIINRVVSVLTVPTSAVHTNGATSTVQVLKNGVPSSVVVTTGAADSSRTEIQSGLSVGDTVVIATVSSTVPSTSGAGRTGGAARGLGGGG